MKVFSAAAILLIAASASADVPEAAAKQLRGVVDTVMPDVVGANYELVDSAKGEKEKEPKPEKADKKADKKEEKSEKTPKPSKAKTPKPTSSDDDRKAKTPKPTPSPTKEDSRSSKTPKPTRKPTKKPTGRSSCDSVDKKKPAAKRNGEKYTFKLEKSGAQCTDDNKKTYSYGLFKKVKKFSECAEACVEDVDSGLLESFRGYDWDCDNEECRCLFDAGALDKRNTGDFDRSSRSESGDGPVEGSKKRSDFFCARLEEVKFVGNVSIEDDEEDEFAYE